MICFMLWSIVKLLTNYLSSSVSILKKIAITTIYHNNPSMTQCTSFWVTKPCDSQNLQVNCISILFNVVFGLQ